MAVPGVAGGWADEVAAVNMLIDDPLWPTTEVTRAVGAVAKGRSRTVDGARSRRAPARGRVPPVAKLVNKMIDQLSVFAAEVTRVAREVGTDGKLGGQAVVASVAGTWKDLTDSVNAMASNLTAQVRNIAGVTTAVARGDLSRKITVDVKGEILELKDTINTMVDQLNGLSADEEAKLKLVAKSIVLKDVQSPERLLDETALFLHRIVADLPERKRQMLARLHGWNEVLEGRKVLVVDDDARNIFALTTVLENYDMEVVSATNGREAIDLIQNTSDLSVVLMDIMMPEMDGYETMREIRRVALHREAGQHRSAALAAARLAAPLERSEGCDRDDKPKILIGNRRSRDRGQGQRPRHLAVVPVARVRALPAGGRVGHARALRSRPRTVHREASRRTARRGNQRPQRGRGPGAIFVVRLPSRRIPSPDAASGTSDVVSAGA